MIFISRLDSLLQLQSLYSAFLSQCVYFIIEYATRPSTHLLLFLLCLTIFIKKDLYFIFTYLVIFFARTYFKKETKHGY